MTRATRAIIDLGALQHNLNIARQQAPASRLMAIIKANGYGHGIIEIAHALREADAFGVACIDEAISLREAGIQQSIVLLEGFARETDLNLINGFELQPVLHHPFQIAMLEQSSGQAVDVWLKIDTGMHRLGFPPDQAKTIEARLAQSSRVRHIHYMTHLANADDRDDSFTRQQIEQFEQAVAGTELPCSIANSAGILGWPEASRDWNRPGIMLYGVSPFVNGSGAQHDLQPVMTLKSELIAVNYYQKGDPVGYGGSWRCPEAMPIGVAAIGYGDGYPRHAQSGTPVLINGRRVPIVGRVSMDMLCLDLREYPAARIGDEVTLWGKGLPVEEIALASGTIAYELLCKVTSRVTFDYRRN